MWLRAAVADQGWYGCASDQGSSESSRPGSGMLVPVHLRRSASGGAYRLGTTGVEAVFVVVDMVEDLQESGRVYCKAVPPLLDNWVKRKVTATRLNQPGLTDITEHGNPRLERETVSLRNQRYPLEQDRRLLDRLPDESVLGSDCVQLTDQSPAAPRRDHSLRS